jgi:iron complex transport system substrate-binding protein
MYDRPKLGLKGLLLAAALGVAGCDGSGAGQGADAGSGPPIAPVWAVDAAGRTVELPRPAVRVVSLLPAATETMLALGGADRLVGRTRYDTDPRVAALPSVGGGLDPSLESIVALAPDLVVAWESASGSPVRERLEAVGIPVFSLAIRDTASIFQTVQNLGRLTGLRPAADSLARSLRRELAAVRESLPPGRRPTVLYVISVDPPIIAGTDNYIAELIEVAGGEPVRISGAARGVSPQVSLEEFVRRQPDVLILPVGPGGVGLERLRREPGWRDLAALREGRAAEVPADLVNRPGPSIGETARLLRDVLHPHVSAR